MKEINLNNKSWQELLALCLRKRDYEVALNEFSSKGLFLRLALAALGRKPQDPVPGCSSDGLGTLYVQAFNTVHHIGTRADLGGGNTLHARVRWNGDDCCPVLTATFVEGADVAYVEKLHVLRNGGVEKAPIPYPDREFSIWGLPDRPQIKELCEMKLYQKRMVEELQDAVKSVQK